MENFRRRRERDEQIEVDQSVTHDEAQELEYQVFVREQPTEREDVSGRLDETNADTIEKCHVFCGRFLSTEFTERLQRFLE